MVFGSRPVRDMGFGVAKVASRTVRESGWSCGRAETIGLEAGTVKGKSIGRGQIGEAPRDVSELYPPQARPRATVQVSLWVHG